MPLLVKELQIWNLGPASGRSAACRDHHCDMQHSRLAGKGLLDGQFIGINIATSTPLLIP
jgi:hypothetical protein